MNRIDFWKEIYNDQASMGDLVTASGYNGTYYRDPKEICETIIQHFTNLNPDSKVLDVGCAAGNIARYVMEYADVVGVDFAENQIDRYHREIGPNAFVGDITNLSFEDKYFDYSWSFTTFHYFPSLKYARQVIEEMKRVSKYGIFIGSIYTEGEYGNPWLNHKWHCIYPKSFIKNIGGNLMLDANAVPPNMHTYNI